MSTPLPPRPSGPGADKHGSTMTANFAHGPEATQVLDIGRQAGARRTL